MKTHEIYDIRRNGKLEGSFSAGDESRFKEISGEPAMMNMHVAVKEFKSYLAARGVPKGGSCELRIIVTH